MATAAVALFDVFTRVFHGVIVASSADDYDVVGGIDKSIFASRIEAVKAEHDGVPPLDEVVSMMLYNTPFIADMQMFDSKDEALSFAQEIAADPPTADEYGKRG